MKNNVNEVLTVEFNTEGNTNPIPLYERTPSVDEMFTLEMMGSNYYPVLLSMKHLPDDEASLGASFAFQYTGYDSNFLIKSGDTLYFYVQAFSKPEAGSPVEGSFKMNFYPATDKATSFDLPAGVNSETLLTTFTPAEQEYFVLDLLDSSSFPLLAELRDSSNTVLESFEFDTATYDWFGGSSKWLASGYAMQAGSAYSLYIINPTSADSAVTGLVQLITVPVTNS